MDNSDYQAAFALKQGGKIVESIAAFKRILDEGRDNKNACHKLIALLYYLELNDYESALPYARESVKKRPLDEMASINLSHCLFEANLKDEMNEEIKRYISTGGKIDSYETLFEENGIDRSNFT